jgi:hypothetical protein
VGPPGWGVSGAGRGLVGTKPVAQVGPAPRRVQALGVVVASHAVDVRGTLWGEGCVVPFGGVRDHRLDLGRGGFEDAHAGSAHGGGVQGRVDVVKRRCCVVGVGRTVVRGRGAFDAGGGGREPLEVIVVLLRWGRGCVVGGGGLGEQADPPDHGLGVVKVDLGVVGACNGATAGERWRLIRHHRAAAAWSSGSGAARDRAEQECGRQAGAGDRGEPLGQHRGEVVPAGVGSDRLEQRPPFGQRGGAAGP